MRINRSRQSVRPGKGRVVSGISEGQMTMSLLSRPYANPHEVPCRPRQSSTVSSQHDLENGLQTNPQWMKKLEEKYRKLHMKIGSYGASGFGERQTLSARHQHLAGMSQYGAAFHNNHRKTPMTSDEKHLDLIRLGMSMDNPRYGNKRGKQYNFQTKSTELRQIVSPLLENSLPARNSSDVQLNRGPIKETCVPVHADDTGTSGLRVGKEASKTDLIGRSQAARHGYAPLGTCIGPTTQGSERNDRDHKYDMSCDKSRRDLLEIRRDIVDSADLVKETTIVEDNQDQTITGLNGRRSARTVTRQVITTRHSSHNTQVNQVDVHERASGDTIDRVSQSKSAIATGRCENGFSHLSKSSTTTSFQLSKLPRESSGCLGQSLAPEVNEVTVYSMSKSNGRVKGSKRHINVFQGMSEEARFAITETKKEMGFRGNEDNSKSAGQMTPVETTGYEVKGKTHTTPMSEQIECSPHNVSRTNIVDRADPSNESCNLGSEKESRREKIFSSASLETLVDETSDHTNCSLGSYGRDNQSELYPKLPVIDIPPRSNAQHGVKYLKNNQSHIPGISRFRVITCMAREQTFEITPPGYDVRFRDILTGDIPESETPPPDIKAEAVAKCSEWLTTKFIHTATNTKAGNENMQ